MQHNFIALAFRKVIRVIKEHKDDEKVSVGFLSSLSKYGYHCYFQGKTHKLHQTVGS